MGDLNTILDGNVDAVTTAVAGMSHVDLHAARKIEEAGKNRKGVLSAIDAALAAAADSANAAAHTAAADAGAKPADLAPADTIDTAGAPQQIVPDVDMSHPAVDADPRAGTTVAQNQIDFNDPNRDGREVVEEALAKGAEG